MTALFGPRSPTTSRQCCCRRPRRSPAYLLCRHLTRSTWASLVGGYLFGFSSYMLGQSQGHMHMTSVFLLPLIALAVDPLPAGRARRPRLRLAARGPVRARGLALDRAAAHRRARARPGARPRLRACCKQTRPRILRDVEAAARRDRARRRRSPPRSSTTPRPASSPTRSTPRPIFDADILNFLLPTHFIWIGGQWLFSISQHFRGNDSEAGSYLGIPTLVIVAWFAFGARRSAVAALPARRARRRRDPDARHGVRRQAARSSSGSRTASSRASRSSTTSCRRGSRCTPPSPPA